jgi:UDP:flavonoid glycosyltransferase YjiC (YdhE family)
MRALTSGAAVVICPASGDQYENAARVRWAKVGVSIPNRFIDAPTIGAAVEKLLSDPSYTERAVKLQAWAADNDGAAAAATEIKAFAGTLST